jgi:hypothetical protein
MASRLHQRVRDPALIAAIGAVAIVLGHSITYALTFRSPQLRASALASSGHGYWFVAVRLGIVVALGVTGTVLFRSAHHGPRPTWIRTESVGSTAAALSVFQVFGFAVMEIAERVAAGARLSGLFTDHLLWLGMIVQIGLAGLVGFALRWLRRIGARIATLSGGAEPAGRWRSWSLVVFPELVRAAVVPSQPSIRAPPPIPRSAAR